MQLVYPGWLPEVVIKKGINMKMTIFQEALIKIGPTLCLNVSCMKPFRFFCDSAFQDDCHLLLLKNSTKHENDISQYF